MPVNAKVANHSGLGLQDTVLQQITEVHLNEASDISLDITPQDIASLSRSGDDLVLTLQNGEVITLDGFYIDPQEQSHLYLEGDEFAGDIYRIDMASTSPGNVPYEAIPVENTIESAVLGAPFSAAGTTLAALGVIGATGLMLGGVNSGGGDDEDSNTSVSPEAPIISSVADNVEPSTGELESGADTNDTTPTLTGTAGAGSSVAIYDSDTLLDTVEADGEGNWSLELTTPLSEGEHSLTAVATDPAGNISDASDAFIITIDTLPPDAPELENSDGTTLSGTGEPGSAITVINNEGEIVGETTVDDDGNFTLDLSPEQEDGAELTATATDGAGNESESSAPITVDAAAPEAPLITAVNDNAEPVTGELSSGDSTNDQTPTLMGTAEAGSSVAVYDGDTLLKTVEADAEGNWSLELSEPLAEGEHNLSAIATDASGNVSDPSDAFVITIDVTAPEAPVLEETDGTTLAGTGEPGATIEITDGNGNPVATTEVGEDGTFSIELDPKPEDGTELTATATDPAGNASGPSNPVIVDTATDTTPPAAGENSIAFGDGGDSFLNADEIGNVTLSGTIEEGLDSGNVQLVITDGEGGSVTVDTADITVDGTTLTVAGQDLSGLAEGELTATLTVTDNSDNAADFTADSIKDTTAPQAPVLEETDGTTLAGTGEPGATVDITDGDGNIVASIEVGDDGNFAITLDPALEDGTELTATATDPAGNTSGPSNPVIVDTATDTTPPAAGENSITFGDGGDGFLNADEIGNVTLSGTIEDGLDSSNVQLIITDGEGGSVTVDTADITVDGTTLTVAGQDLSELAEGELTATLTVTDDSNNANDFTADSVKDTTALEVPVLEETDGTTLAGTGEPGATVDITDGDGNIVASIEVGDEGNFEITLDPALEDGTQLTATATDPAGNASGPSNPVIVDTATDTTPPAEGENSIAFSDGGDGFLNADEIGNVTLSGTIEDGLDSSSVQLVITDGAGGSVTVDSADITIDGTTLTVAGQDLSGLAEGELTATLTVTDNSDNAADFTADSIKDTTAPEAPVLEETDGTTLAGTGEPGATVDITDGNGNPVATTEVEEDGTFSIELDPMPEDGTELTATATDPAGNTSGPSNPVIVDTATDTTPPAAGENSIAFGDGGDGFLNADEIGNVTLTGTIEEGLDSSNVQLIITDGAGGFVTVDTADITVDGTTLTVAGQDLSGLAEGELTATLTVTDNSDNAADFTADSVKDTVTDTPTLNDTDGTTLAGTGEPGATIEITDGNGNPVATTEVEEDGTFSIELDPMPEDGTELTATATDPAGNTSGPSNPVIVDTATDTTPPAAGDNSIAFGDGDDGFLNADEIGNVTLSGTIEDGLDSSNVQLIITDGAGGSVTVDTAEITIDGTTLTVAGQDLSGLAEGELTATLTVTDNSDNAAEFTADSVKDTVTDTPTLNDTDGTTLSGTGEPGATIEITDGNGNPVATTEVEEDGTFSIELDPMPEDGTELTATATDPAGNTSGPSNPVTVDTATDTTPPAAGENSIAFGDGGDGFLNADEIGNVTLSGTIEDGLDSGNVQLVITDGAGGSVTVDTADITVDGTTLTVAGQDLSELAEGELTATLTVSDNAGNAAQFDDVATKDTIAPDAPVLEATDGSELTGTGEPNTTVTITDGNGNVIGSADIDEEGNFTAPLHPAQEDGADLTATVTDDAGNTSGPATATVDATAPVAADNSIAFGDGDDGFLNADEIGNVTLSGTIEDGLDSGNIQLVITDGAGGSVTVDTADITVDGTTLTVAGQDLSELAEGELTATLTVTDNAGNAAQFDDVATKDTIAPAAPVLEATDGSELTGTGEPNTTVTITDDNGNVIGSADVDEEGNFTAPLNPVQEDGADLTATATDPAGNTSGPTTATVDATSPGGEDGTDAPVLTIDEAADGVTAAELADGLQTSVTLTNGTEEGDTVTVTLNDGNGGTITGEATVTAQDITDGSIAVGVTDAIADGSYTATAVITDALGNSSAESNAIDVNVDATSPGGEDGTDAPVLTIDEAADGVTAAELADGLQTSVTLTNGTEEGDTVTVTLDDGNGGTITGEAIVTAQDITNDSIAVKVTDAIADGSYTATAVITDALGNSSAESNAIAVNVDATAPDAPILELVNDSNVDGDRVTNEGEVLVSGLEAGATWEYSVNGGTDWQAGTGNSFVLGEGVYATGDVQARQIDVAGNTSETGNLEGLTVDTTSPVTPTLSLTTDTNIDGDNITSIGEVTVDGLEEAATWEYSIDGGNTWETGIGATFDLDQGIYNDDSIQVRQSDLAGNTSDIVALNAEIDVLAPTTTVTIDAISDDTGTAGDFITSDNDGLTITATLDAALAEGETLQYSTDGVTWVDITTSVNGTNISYVDTALTESSTVQLKVQDTAGNDGARAERPIVIDTVAPTTTVTIDAISVDTGLPDDFITSDNNGLTLTGTLDAPLEDGEALLYSVDGGVTWVDITSSVSGSAINHDDATLTESATVQLKVRDTAGNDGPVAEKAIIIDTIAPDTTVTIDSISLDSGIPDDFITNDNDGLTITATLAAPLAADETLQYSTDGTTWIDVPAASVTGTAVSYDSGLTESATVQLRVQDAAGNTGPETSQDVVIDTTTPTTTVTIDAISEDTGTAGDFITSDNDGLTITATLAAPLAADETLQYSTDGTTWIDVPAASVIGTAVSYDSGLTESATVQLRVQDAAGNIGPATSQDVVIDATAPSAADNSIDFVDGGDETLSLDEITSVQLTGAVEDGIDSNDVVITITDSESGSISVDVADITITDGILSTTGQDLSGLAEGELTVTMNVTDEAGNSTDFIDTSTKDTVATLSTGSTAVTEDALGTSAPAAEPALMAFSFASFAALPASDNDATVDDTVSTGQLTYTNVSDTASFALEVPTDATLTQDGAELDWVLSEDGKTLQAVNNAGDIAATVLQISIDDRGSYTTELFSELDHTLQGADSLNFSVGVVLTDGEEVIDSSISVKVIDDTPELSTSFLHHDVTAAGNAVGDNLLGVAGFGADGGYISSITFDGVTFSIEQDALTQGFNVTTSGASELLDLSTPVSVTNDGMTLTTLLGETFTIDLVTGAYTYDYDGDLAIVDDGNTAPTPAINQSGGLLGIINLDALGLIDISEQQIFTVSDPDNDLTSVSLEYTAVLSLTGFEWAYNEELATELGLQVTPTFDPGFLGIGDVAGLTITPLEGSTMDAQAVNELLATVFLPDSVLGLNLVPTVTLSATDSEGTVDTSATDLLDLSLLTAGGSGANVLTGTDNADLTTLTAPADTSTRLYGYDGDDTITGSNQADILRGGADNDSMNGGAGSDLMIGGTGNDTMTGGAGIDIFRWEDGHEGAVGAPATDLITDFDPSGLTTGSSGDIIDLRTLLQGEGYVTAEISNLSRYLNFAEQGGDTVLSISTTGDFTGETTDSDLVDQIITFEGTSLFQGDEDSADLIARLISEGKLLVDEATSTTVLEDITREVDLTYTDGDGDSVQGKLEFSGDAPSITDTSNSAPTIVGASQQLLGLVGLDALGLVDLSQNALFVADADGNLQSVTIAFSPLLNVDLSSLLGAPELTVNTALAEEFGLSVETTSSAGLLGLLAPSASVTISAAEGETIDNLQINELLSTLDFNQSDLLSLSLLDYLTVSATDDDGATTSLSLSSLLDANVLDSGEGSSVFIDETGADVLDASAAGINVSLYGLEGDDALTGGSGNDLLRGGEGNDTLTGGAGNDLLFGEAGDNTFDGGLGDDTIVTSTLDFSIDGGLGEDTVQFDGTGESIDLSSLLDTNTGTSEMLNIEVLDISESSETGSTLTLDTDAVLNLTDDNDTLRIEGDSNDSVQADGAEMTGQEVINGATYDTYALGSATLYIDQDVTVTTNNA
ncbi:BapA prefix-like domain-containing protein [Cobetia sp. 4B]|uniref:Ig-like domain-containing protein n=1 Tax=Cobetia sp. 4B TaxID=2758724 RepID=UPI001C03DD0A|nr:Ig-like domain-containing protein [Cobetia sp. 4B]QWN35843.1 BapA prefix-like domain-containing protein [Cobetia sp. 4B]